ncbi:MAG: hypothetical protein BWY11_00135 [Firmicutes bacterium ADurb.Bin182]|nr:MAG: hypothetical protein BWY11_00135 [Firmicutes bacterium ADurb.Bin182]
MRKAQKTLKLLALLIALLTAFGTALPALAEGEADIEAAVAAPEAPEAPAPLFPGMPQGFVLSKAELAKKERLVTTGMLSDMEKMVPGVDYVESEIIFRAETKEEAASIAAAYGAELLSFDYTVAVAKINPKITVLDCMKAAADLSSSLPAVYPNHIIKLDPIEREGKRLNSGKGEYSTDSIQT